jgi:hypothetical protein
MIDRAFVFPAGLVRAVCVVAAPFMFAALSAFSGTTVSARHQSVTPI